MDFVPAVFDLVLSFKFVIYLLMVFFAQNTQNPSCLKQFLDHHGLSLLWIFMVELSEAKGNSATGIKMQIEAIIYNISIHFRFFLKHKMFVKFKTAHF